MVRSNRVFIILFTCLLTWAGCSSSENFQPLVADYPGEPSVQESSWPAMAIVDWGSVDFSDPAVVAKFAQADILVLETAYLWQPGKNPGAIAALKELNPDLKIVGYISAHSSWLRWGVVDRSEQEEPSYNWEWYQATREYWSYSTTGDTMLSWPGKALLNVLDPDCRAAMVQVLTDHWHAHDNVLDGIFWDHFNAFLWVQISIPGVEGQMDLDGDGIPHREDEDEMQAYREASADLISRARRALGGDVIQIANGQRAAADSAFAGLLDGMFYENFPEYSFTGEKMRKALDPSVPNNLFAAATWPRSNNGGPWLILSNANRFTAQDDEGVPVSWRRAEFNRVVGLLTGCLPVYHAEGLEYQYGWPEIEVELGLPLAEAVIQEDRISREFEYGSVHLDFSGSTSLIPFDFAIVQKDSVRQQFNMADFLP